MGSSAKCQEKDYAPGSKGPHAHRVQSIPVMDAEANYLDSQRERPLSPVNRLKSVAGVTSLGGFLGYAAGVATKRLSKLIIVVVGVIFLVTQSLSYYGYLTVDWRKVSKDASPSFDKEKRKEYAQRFYRLLTQNLPFKVGFGSGYYLGLLG
eukprot:gene13708-16160_t